MNLSRAAFAGILVGLAFTAGAQPPPPPPPPPAVKGELYRPPQTAAPQAPAPQAPAPSGQSASGAHLIALPVLGEQQIRELISDLSLHLEITGGYKRIPLTQAPKELAPFPATVTPAGIIVRDDRDYHRFGFVQPPRRLPQLWVHSFSLQGGQIGPNPDGDPRSLEGTVRT